MKFTPSQALELSNVPPQTLRYWKAHLKPLAQRRGHAPSYTRGDLLALIVIRRLVQDFKMDVNAVIPYAEELFQLCQVTRYHQVSTVLAFTLDSVTMLNELSPVLNIDIPTIVFPIHVAVQELNTRLNDQEQEPQLQLGLPPVAVRKSESRT